MYYFLSTDFSSIYAMDLKMKSKHNHFLKVLEEFWDCFISDFIGQKVYYYRKPE